MSYEINLRLNKHINTVENISIEKVCSDNLTQIFNYLSLSDLKNTSCVNRLWNKLSKSTLCYQEWKPWKMFLTAVPEVQSYDKNEVKFPFATHLVDEIVLSFSSDKDLRIPLEQDLKEKKYKCVFLKIYKDILLTVYQKDKDSGFFIMRSIENGKIINSHHFSHFDFISNFLCTQNNKYVAFCNTKLLAKLHILNPESKECQPVEIDSSIRNYHINQIEIKDDKLIAIFDNGYIQIWDISTGQSICIIQFVTAKFQDPIPTKIAVHNTMNKIAIAFVDWKKNNNYFKIYDLDKGKVVHKSKLKRWPCDFQFIEDSNSTYKLTEFYDDSMYILQSLDRVQTKKESTKKPLLKKAISYIKIGVESIIPRL